MWTGNYVPGNNSTQAALSNGQIFIQKTDGWFQFYLQAGAYNIPALGAPFLATDKTVTNLYGPVPVAYLKLQAGKNTSILVGALPTLIGAEYTFTFENMNIARGLLWNQENAVNRGIQVNQTMGKVTASLSWNDGFYSNRYSWLTGSLTYANGPHSLAFVAGGNLGKTAFQSYATPVQNNGSIYNVIYTYTQGVLDCPTLLAIHQCAHRREDRHRQGRVHQWRCDLSESRFQARFRAPAALRIYCELGNRRPASSQPDVRSRQRGHVDHRDAHLSIRRVLLSRRRWLCSPEQPHAG